MRHFQDQHFFRIPCFFNASLRNFNFELTSIISIRPELLLTNMPDNSPDKIIENFHVKTAAFVRQVFAFGLERNIYYSIYIL